MKTKSCSGCCKCRSALLHNFTGAGTVGNKLRPVFQKEQHTGDLRTVTRSLTFTDSLEEDAGEQWEEEVQGEQ